MQEAPRQRKDVSRPIAQQRQSDGNHFQTVIEVFPKAALSNFMLQIAICGGNKPDVDGDGSRGSYTVDDPLLERAKKLGLNRKGEFADLVQKQCSSGSEFKLSFPQRVGAGKGAAFM